MNNSGLLLPYQILNQCPLRQLSEVTNFPTLIYISSIWAYIKKFLHHAHSSSVLSTIQILFSCFGHIQKNPPALPKFPEFSGQGDKIFLYMPKIHQDCLIFRLFVGN